MTWSICNQKCTKASIHNATVQITSNSNTHKIPRHRRILMRNHKNVQRRLNKIRNVRTTEHLEHKIIEMETALLKSCDVEEIRKEDKAVLNDQKNSKYFFQFEPDCETRK